MAEQVLLGLDVGGSSIKAALVDIELGRTVTPLQTTPTPAPVHARCRCCTLCAQLDRELGARGTGRPRLPMRWYSTAWRAPLPMSTSPGSAMPAEGFALFHS